MNQLSQDPATLAERREAHDLQMVHGCWACTYWQPIRTGPGQSRIRHCQRGEPDAGHRNTTCRLFDLDAEFRADAYTGAR